MSLFFVQPFMMTCLCVSCRIVHARREADDGTWHGREQQRAEEEEEDEDAHLSEEAKGRKALQAFLFVDLIYCSTYAGLALVLASAPWPLRVAPY